MILEGLSAAAPRAEQLLDEPWGRFHHWPVCARKLGLIGGAS